MDTSKFERQEVLWVPETRRIQIPGPELTDSTVRVWTLYTHTDPDNKPKLPYSPVHFHGAFLEDYVHDWHHDPKTGVFRYFSRGTEGKVWILMEYFKAESKPGKRRKL